MNNGVPAIAEYLARFLHPRKFLPPLPGVNETLDARMFGLAVGEYEALLARIGARTIDAASELLEDPDAVRILERLGERPTTVVGLGDSLTDDANSWLEILRAASEQTGSQLNFVNAGITGETSVQMLARMPQVFGLKPDIVVCLSGTNDVRRFGTMREPQMSVGASTEALRKLRAFAAQTSGCGWLWLTPAGIDEKAAGDHWFWRVLDISWTSTDLAAIAAAISDFSDPVVDLFSHFSGSGSSEFASEDGVHPETETHLVIARHVLSALEGLRPVP